MTSVQVKAAYECIRPLFRLIWRFLYAVFLQLLDVNESVQNSEAAAFVVAEAEVVEVEVVWTSHKNFNLVSCHTTK